MLALCAPRESKTPMLTQDLFRQCWQLLMRVTQEIAPLKVGRTMCRSDRNFNLPHNGF